MLGNSSFERWEADVDSKDLLVGTAYGTSEAEAQGNADLFATAPALPELLETCRNHAEWLGTFAVTVALYGDTKSHGIFKDKQAEILNAIAKAEKGQL